MLQRSLLALLYAAAGIASALNVKGGQQQCPDEGGSSEGQDGIAITVDLSNSEDAANLENLLKGLESCSWAQQIPKYIFYNDQAKHPRDIFVLQESFSDLNVKLIDMDKPLDGLHMWSHPQEMTAKEFDDDYGLGYRMMCDTWATRMPEVAKRLGLKYLMRLDSDSKLTCTADRQQNPFDVMRSKCLKYGYYNLSRDFWWLTKGFKEFLIGYLMSREGHFLKDAMENVGSVTLEPEKVIAIRPQGAPDAGHSVWLGRKMFYNNFEILKVDHFLQDSVKEFTEAVASNKGIYLHRWGDAVIRYYQVTLFAKKEEIQCFSSADFSYSHPNSLGQGSNDDGTCTKQIV